MQESSDGRFPVSKDLLALERQERRFHREVNGTDYVSWQQLLRRVRPDQRYRISHFGMPRVLARGGRVDSGPRDPGGPFLHLH